jgi:hypothetical protein
MSRVVASVVVVLLAVALVLAGYDLLMGRMGFPSLVAPLYSVWLDVNSALGAAVMGNKVWTTVIVAGIVVGLLIARLPKYGRY